MRVLALAGYDSFLNTARLIAPYFERQRATVDFALVSARKKKQISDGQVAELGFSNPIPVVTIKGLCQSREIKSYDIVLSCLEGMSTRHLFHYLQDLGSTRPLVICVYPGLVLRYAFDGFSMRAPADFLWLNCERDVEAYTAMCESFDQDASNARLFGNASLLEKIERKSDVAAEGPVVFFEQAVIPRYYHERRFLAEQLCALARRYPGKEFLIKARAAGKKATLHRTWHAIDHLFGEVASLDEGVPANIHLTEERTPALLARASHCLTISSTVAIEALHAGIDTTLIADFGAHDDYGLQYFYGSGLLRSFEHIDLDVPPRMNKHWGEQFVLDPLLSIKQLVSEAMQIGRDKRSIENVSSRQCENSDALREAFLQESPDFYLSRSFKRKRKILDILKSHSKLRSIFAG
ncbi:DUF6716 putative glycosyltransferase [uncultured Roseibium sp.]|uniref:DUF6716 putative glycosyltransferase n=1 Tax=uncultured Roseibium sp. TaxID=1936171 RepID=UPI00262A7E79|nr:DUF6716 putative glycosyltransferase [uncultured Roseibium sp.]